MQKVSAKTTGRMKRALLVLVLLVLNSVAVSAQTADPIPGYIGQINSTNLINVATKLVNDYGPRRGDAFSPYVNANCVASGVVYPKSNILMAVDYVKGVFQNMGYDASAITVHALPGDAGANIYVTKVGSVYPNVFIEFGGHLDTVAGSPGGADNASGATAVIELARVLKDYPNRHSMRFVLWAAEEYHPQRGAYYGSSVHVQSALARGEQIKAGLVMDHIGWPYPADPTGYMNEVSYLGDESQRIADLFNQVRSDYNIAIGYGKDQAIQNSDEHSYWDNGQVAVSSGGGWLFYRPNYHSCGDTVANIDVTNVLRTAQQNLAVGLRLDGEPFPPTGPTATPVTVTPVTATPSPVPTSTPAGTATNTPVPVAFPSTGVLDNFNRNDGPLVAPWSGNVGDYRIVSGRLDVGTSEDVYWSSPSFAADQEVHVTLSAVDPTAAEIGLILKAQNNAGFNAGLIDVLFDPAGARVQVWTYHSTQGWVQRGGNLPVAFANGDQFGARVNAAGQVTVYRNGAAVGTVSVTAWPLYAGSGYIGLFMLSAPNTLIDNFGGGTVGSGPVSTATNTPVPTATNTPVPTATNTPVPTATNTPLPTATNTPVSTATNTPVPTATNTPVPAATNTPVSAATNTPVPTATNTPGPGGFPATGLLDTFNRPNGPLGTAWSGKTSQIFIVDGKMDLADGETDIYWNSTSFGVDQEAYVTLSKIDAGATELGLILRAQSNSGYSPGLVDVLYDPIGKTVQVWTYTNGKGWVMSGAPIQVSMSDGDILGARALSTRSVEVYRNGVLLGARTLQGWPYAQSGGYLGLYIVNAGTSVVDDFGGGTLPGTQQ